MKRESEDEKEESAEEYQVRPRLRLRLRRSWWVRSLRLRNDFVGFGVRVGTGWEVSEREGEKGRKVGARWVVSSKLRVKSIWEDGRGRRVSVCDSALA